MCTGAQSWIPPTDAGHVTGDDSAGKRRRVSVVAWQNWVLGHGCVGPKRMGTTVALPWPDPDKVRGTHGFLFGFPVLPAQPWGWPSWPWDWWFWPGCGRSLSSTAALSPTKEDTRSFTLERTPKQSMQGKPKRSFLSDFLYLRRGFRCYNQQYFIYRNFFPFATLHTFSNLLA